MLYEVITYSGSGVGVAVTATVSVAGVTVVEFSAAVLLPHPEKQIEQINASNEST